MKNKYRTLAGVFLVCSFLPAAVSAYPVDGYETTGIRRLARLQMIIDGRIAGPMPLPGARKSYADIRLNLMDRACPLPQALPPADPALQKKIQTIFPNRDESYSLAVLDITPGRPQRFAQIQSERRFAVGSVGKLAVAAGLFSELKRLYPDSTEKRAELLRTRMVTAGKWIHTDHHEVPVFNPETREFALRPVQEGDTFSLYEWADHMLSASANSAASMVWKEVILMRKFGPAYPPAPEAEDAFFRQTPKKELAEMAMAIVNDPLKDLGISREDWHLGSFFTSTGKKMVPGYGDSKASPLGLLKYLTALEKGMVVDTWSSLEIKRLMYMTAKRIRYASAPRLGTSAVYFKSGSLYRCKPEPDFKCGKYKGNVENVMNSVAIIEHPDGRTYLVALMSDVLKKNSAVEHQTIATYIDKILTEP